MTPEKFAFAAVLFAIWGALAVFVVIGSAKLDAKARDAALVEAMLPERAR